jgi:hypothetical protein
MGKLKDSFNSAAANVSLLHYAVLLCLLELGVTTWGTVNYINVQEYSTLSREGIKLIVLVNIYKTITVSYLFNICNDLRDRAVWDRVDSTTAA